MKKIFFIMTFQLSFCFSGVFAQGVTVQLTQAQKEYVMKTMFDRCKGDMECVKCGGDLVSGLVPSQCKSIEQVNMLLKGHSQISSTAPAAELADDRPTTLEEADRETEGMLSISSNQAKNWISPSCLLPAYIDNRKTMDQSAAIHKVNTDCFSRDRFVAAELPICIHRNRAKVDDVKAYCNCKVGIVADQAQQYGGGARLSPNTTKIAECNKKFSWGKIDRDKALARSRDREAREFFPEGYTSSLQQYLDIDP